MAYATRMAFSHEIRLSQCPVVDGPLGLVQDAAQIAGNLSQTVLMIQNKVAQLEKDTVMMEAIKKETPTWTNEKVLKLKLLNKSLKQKVNEQQGKIVVLTEQRDGLVAENKRISIDLQQAQFSRSERNNMLTEKEVKVRIDKALAGVISSKDREYAMLEREYCDYRNKKEAELKVIQSSLMASAAAARNEGEIKEIQRECEAYKKAADRAERLLAESHERSVEAQAECELQRREYNQMELCVKQLRQENAQHCETIRKLREQLQEGEAERRNLHNQVMELKGNIRVYCRVRPILKSEIPESSEAVEDMYRGHTAGRGIEVFQPRELARNDAEPRKWSFTFDRVFSDSEKQENVFDDVSGMVQSALDGYRVCIFAYGQTGSGKTYTMLGTPENPGVIPRATHQIFSHSEKLSRDGWKVSLQASFLEIYNESVRDLLAANAASNGIKYEVKHDRNAKESYVTNLTSVEVRTKAQVDDLILRSMKNRATAATKSNDQSSRSHCVFRLRIEGKNETRDEHFKGLLNLIDLAGSERVKVSGAEGARLREATHINKSLSALGDVIAALANKDKHVPYRNSKLTYFLQDSLGGDSKTLMFVNLSPVPRSFNESLCSLRFAKKVNACEIGTATKNARVDFADVI